MNKFSYICKRLLTLVLVFVLIKACSQTSIWSARRHPIYQLIEIADEEPRLWLRPEIDKLVQERIVTSRSKLSDQHQGHDAILEEINKTLKSLVPLTVATALRVRIRNCTYKGIDFIKAKLTKETLLGIWQPISTIREEANSQKAESSLTKSQILSIINSLTPF